MKIKLFFLLLLLLQFCISRAQWQVINTGIDDDFNGVMFIENLGVLTGDRGLYFTINGGLNSEDWVRYNIFDNPSDSLIYNQTKFTHCYRNPALGGTSIVFACGQDTVNETAVVLKVSLVNFTYDFIFIGEPGTKLNNIDYCNFTNSYYAVGDDGLIVKFGETYATIQESEITGNISFVSFYSSSFWMGLENSVATGTLSSTVITVNAYRDEIDNCKDAIGITSGSSQYVGSGYYYQFLESISENTSYDFGDLNGNCLSRVLGYTFVGTDHGVFKSVTTNNSPIEWQPSSENFKINSMWNHAAGGASIYAASDNGVLLLTTNSGGETKPFVKLYCEGGCYNDYISINATSGTSNLCKYYLDGVLIHTGCGSFNHHFTANGSYTLQIIGTNSYMLSDTSTKIINIVDRPLVNFDFSVSDTLLCHGEQIEIFLDSSQNDVFYCLKRYSASNYGCSESGNNQPLSFTSSVISVDDVFYIRAQSVFANCYDDFEDSVHITIERTEADFHNGMFNTIPNEELQLFETCKEAQHFEWTFPTNASISGSTEQNPILSFNSTGETLIKLKCWSDDACYDSIQMNGPFVYAPPSVTDSCWTNVNNGIDPTWEGYYSEDIAQISPCTNGYLVCGHYKDMKFATQIGDSASFEDSKGAYLLKYNLDGVPKWGVNTIETTDTREHIFSVVEDGERNIYVCGNSEGYFVDNSGELHLIDTADYQSHDQFIIKLDSTGSLIWKITSRLFTPYYLNIDSNNNLYVLGNSWQLPMPFEFNGVPNDTVQLLSEHRNKSILKISAEGEILHNIDFTMPGANLPEIIKTTCDSEGNLFVCGRIEDYIMIYPTNQVYDTIQEQDGYPAYELFLLKFNSIGELQWKTKAYTYLSDINVYDEAYPIDMITDNEGNSYLCGSNDCFNYTHLLIFENSDMSTTTKSVGGCFMLKVDANGICSWINGVQYSHHGKGHALCFNDDEIWFLGESAYTTDQTETFEFTSIGGNEAIVSLHYSDYFVAVYDALGKLMRIYKNGENSTLINRFGFSGFFAHDTSSCFLASNIYHNSGTSEFINFGDPITQTNEREGTVTRFNGGCGLVYYPPLPTTVEKNNIDFDIYPNPTQTHFVISGANSDYYLKVEVINSIGELVLNIENNSLIDVSSLKPGIYLVKIFDNNSMKHSKKIIKL